MSWLGILLIGFAVTDLVHSARRSVLLPGCLGALLALSLGLLAGLGSGRDVVALLAIAAVVLAWGLAVPWGFGHPGPTWLPLVLFGSAVLVAVGASGLAPEAAGPLGRWLDSVALPALDSVGPDRFLLVLGAVGIQLSTGNVLVRLVLKSTGTINPAADGTLPPTRLKGGRLLGPLERIFILALALGGEVTAASIVVAAKGLLRFPELNRDPDRIHDVTEYFLLGSFVSWLIALGSYALLV